ncbi:TPA: hypothetical protein HJT74_001049 [Escherichia coli]|nr:hypothetical protein [Escherichia coli]
MIGYIEHYNHHRIKERLEGISPVQERLKHFSQDIREAGRSSK